MDRVPGGGFYLIGVFVGLGLKYLWEVLRLPGYGIKLFILPKTSHDNSVGADDLLLWLLALAVAFYGGTRDKKTLLFGLGVLTGLLISKLFEIYDTTPAGIITPASFAPFPPPS
jgi:hypothetical protein